MEVNEVPQEGNRTLGHHRKALYARDASGRVIIVPSCGSEVDETVTLQAVERMHALADDAKRRVLALDNKLPTTLGKRDRIRFIDQ